MSLFGDSPTETPLALNRSRISLFDDEIMTKSQGNSLFQDDDPSNTTPGGTGTGSDSPWAFPTPRKQQSRAEMVRSLLPAGADVPDAYVDTFDAVLRSGDDGEGVSTASGKVGAQGIARTLASAKLGVEDQARIMTVLSPGGGVAGAGSSGGELAFGRAEFNVLLALIGLAQEGETVSLDSVDERRRSKCICSNAAAFPAASIRRCLSPRPRFLPFCLRIQSCFHDSNSLRRLVLRCATAIGAVLAIGSSPFGSWSLGAKWGQPKQRKPIRPVAAFSSIISS